MWLHVQYTIPIPLWFSWLLQAQGTSCSPSNFSSNKRMYFLDLYKKYKQTNKKNLFEQINLCLIDV